MSPLVGRYRPSSSRPKVVFPDPVSPTRASVWPRRMASETPSTALSVARARPVAVQPEAARPAEKYLQRSRVSMIGGSAPPRPASAPPAVGWPLPAVTGVPRSGVRSQCIPACIRAAVHVEYRAGDVGGRVRAEEEHGLGDVPRMPGPAERDGPDEGGPQFFRCTIRVGVAPLPNVDVAGGDDVHPDAARAEF